MFLCATWGLGSFASSAAETTGAWSQRVQIFYEPATRSIVRKNIRVWDFHPERQLDFLWEPSARQSPNTEISSDGTVNGKGKLIWRVRGSANYDQQTVFSTYVGGMKNGRADGQGRLEIRSGEVWEGNWAGGELNGTGTHLDATGSRFEGQFAAGLPNGNGTLYLTTGEIFEGRFVNGLKDGQGRTILPGGTVYSSSWTLGREELKRRPTPLSDATSGGLIAASSIRGAADKTEIGVSVNQRLNLEAIMAYQTAAGPDAIEVFPERDDIVSAWRGMRKLVANTAGPGEIEWDKVRTFLDIETKSTDRSNLRLKSTRLQVASSEVFRRPMLRVESGSGCVGFRPYFAFLNDGWGGVEDATISFHFVRKAFDAGWQQVTVGEPSPDFSQTIGDFSSGVDVSLEDLFQQLNVNAASLTNERFSCSSHTVMDQCGEKLRAQGIFGEMSDYVWVSVPGMSMNTTLEGSIRYNWTDDSDVVHQEYEPFEVTVQMAALEIPDPLFECGDGAEASPEAMQFQDIKLVPSKSGYSVNLTLKGNKTGPRFVNRLKLWSDTSSITRFRVVSKFADGSERLSKPVIFHYFRPNFSKFTPRQPPSCYLSSNYAPCG